MSGRIENGCRAEVVFGPYVGEAGIVDAGNGQLRVAFTADYRKLRDVKAGTIAAAAHDVLAVERSGAGGKPGVAGMVVLTVQPQG